MPDPNKGKKVAIQSPVVTAEHRPDDPCPNCGIHWQYFARNRDSCGDGYGKPGCFFEAVSDA